MGKEQTFTKNDSKPIIDQSGIFEFRGTEQDDYLGILATIALTAADLGIAIGGGSDVAMECSDIVLLRNDLMDVLNVISLSRRVLNTIRLGLFWAFFYNFVCVIIATGAFYYISGFKINPMIGALAMSVSSVSVVLNALTINFFKIKRAKKADKSTKSNPDAQQPAEGSGCNNENKKTEKENKAMKKYLLKVNGMMCGMCEKHVNAAVRKAAEISDVTSSHESGTTEITCESPIDAEAVKAAIIEAGYEVEEIREL